MQGEIGKRWLGGNHVNNGRKKKKKGEENRQTKSESNQNRKGNYLKNQIAMKRGE